MTSRDERIRRIRREAGIPLTEEDIEYLLALQDDPGQPFDAKAFGRGMAGSARAARKWTDEEKALVDLAILKVARRRMTFNADHVWKQLAGSVPVTKGLSGRLNSAVHSGIIESTGRTQFAQRGGKHDHRQRLAVWRSLIWEKGRR